MNRTLTREQIETILDGVSHVGVCPEVLWPDELKDLCNMALNSIPLDYNFEDKSTWPEKEQKYFCITTEGKPLVSFWLAKAWRGKGLRKHDPRLIAKYMPTPEVET